MSVSRETVLGLFHVKQVEGDTLIYLDNAATTWPKPEAVYRAADEALRRAANPGRGGHKFSRDSARLVLQSRETVARFFGVQDSRQIIFTSGATEGLNTIINGLVPQLKAVLSTGFEHNALWRPLQYLAGSHKVDVTFIDPMEPGGFNWPLYEEALRKAPNLVAITHASNVTGQVFPLQEMVRKAKETGAMVCVDVSQTAGIIDLDFEQLGLDFAAFPGHKGLLGPQGVGGFYIRPGIELRPLRLGGTGGRSEAAEPPVELPERFEAGTINISGIAGLAAGVEYLEQRGLAAVLAHELNLRKRLQQGVNELGGIVYGGESTIGVLSFNFPGIDSAELAFLLDDLFNICVRGGLHCSPRSHQALGTMQPGTLRVSPGLFNTIDDIETLLMALKQILQMTG